MAYSEKISTDIEHYLTKKDWQHSYDAIRGVFTVEADLSCQLGTALLLFSVQEDGFLCYAALPINIPVDARSSVGEYLHRANFGLPNGNFEFDYDEGSIHFKIWTACPGELVSDAQIDDCFAIALTVIDRYGNGLKEVAEHAVSFSKRIIDALDESIR